MRAEYRFGRIAALFLFLVSVVAPAVGAKSLTILYSASLGGNLSGCSCNLRPTAGLVKRAAFLRTYPETFASEEGEPYFLVDAGDVVDLYPDRELGREIFEVYKELGYDAVALGDNELAAGVKGLVKRRGPYGVLLNNNLTLTSVWPLRSPYSSGPRIVERGDVRVGVFALAEPEVFGATARDRRPRVLVADPLPTAKEMTRRCRKEGVDIVLLLYHGRRASLEDLLAECEGIDVAIFGHEERLVPPEKIGSTIVASPGERGNCLGILSLSTSAEGISSFSARFRGFSYSDDPDDLAVRERIDRYVETMRSRINER